MQRLSFPTSSRSLKSPRRAAADVKTVNVGESKYVCTPEQKHHHKQQQLVPSLSASPLPSSPNKKSAIQATIPNSNHIHKHKHHSTAVVAQTPALPILTDTIVVDAKKAKVMRNISGLGMEDAVFASRTKKSAENRHPLFTPHESVLESQQPAPEQQEHPSLNIFDDMSFSDIPEGMKDIITVASDKTATTQDGLDLQLFHASLGDIDYDSESFKRNNSSSCRTMHNIHSSKTDIMNLQKSFSTSSLLDSSQQQKHKHHHHDNRFTPPTSVDSSVASDIRSSEDEEKLDTQKQKTQPSQQQQNQPHLPSLVVPIRMSSRRKLVSKASSSLSPKQKQKPRISSSNVQQPEQQKEQRNHDLVGKISSTGAAVAGAGTGAGVTITTTPTPTSAAVPSSQRRFSGSQHPQSPITMYKSNTSGSSKNSSRRFFHAPPSLVAASVSASTAASTSVTLNAVRQPRPRTLPSSVDLLFPSTTTTSANHEPSSPTTTTATTSSPSPRPRHRTRPRLHSQTPHIPHLVSI